MKTEIELPLTEPVYSTYPSQGSGSAILSRNGTIRNWYLNEVMNLTCNRKFLRGLTTPEISVDDSTWGENPFLEKRRYDMQFLQGYIHPVIRNLLDAGYYVYFGGIDDYYVEGKSWYRERHFYHDGILCGYNRKEKTYSIYSYDKNWIYQKFRTPQKAFENGRRAAFRHGVYGVICGIRPKQEPVAFSPERALCGIARYLDSSMEKYPEDGEGPIYGIVVQRYIAGYVEKLYDGSVPHERMDRRVFRMIWEHKKVMLERIGRIEEELKLGNDVSEKYRSVVSEANTLRMLYASHHLKRRDSVLPVIRDRLLALMQKERELLQELIEITKGKNRNETLE